MALGKKRDSEARRRKQPPKDKEKLSGGQAEIALARNVAELESRILRANRTALSLKITIGRLESQKEMLEKIAGELAESGAFDLDAFKILVQKELEDAGVIEPSAEEDDDEELE